MKFLKKIRYYHFIPFALALLPLWASVELLSMHIPRHVMYFTYSPVSTILVDVVFSGMFAGSLLMSWKLNPIRMVLNDRKYFG